jgi:hypothetical protein
MNRCHSHKHSDFGGQLVGCCCPHTHACEVSSAGSYTCDDDCPVAQREVRKAEKVLKKVQKRMRRKAEKHLPRATMGNPRRALWLLAAAVCLVVPWGYMISRDISYSWMGLLIVGAWAFLERAVAAGKGILLLRVLIIAQAVLLMSIATAAMAHALRTGPVYITLVVVGTFAMFMWTLPDLRKEWKRLRER